MASAPTVAHLRAFRGHDNGVKESHEELLVEIWTHFDRLKLTAPASISHRRILIMSSQRWPIDWVFRDWYVPRNADPKAKWVLETDFEEQTTLQHVVDLHRLGVPTFLREQLPPSAMRLFLKVSAFMHDEAATSIENKEALLHHILKAAGHAAVQLFGDHRRSNHVAVFDASGFSTDAGRTKLSMRIVFVEIAADETTATRFRQLVLSNLIKSPLSTPLWHKTMMPATREARPPADPKQFWEGAIEDKVYRRRKELSLRLVWCDTAKGEMDLPERRPLVPHGLFKVVAPRKADRPLDGLEGPETTLEASSLADELSDVDWSRLGSLYMAEEKPTEYQQPQKAQPVRQSAALPRPAAANSVEERWFEYIDTETGKPYYFNSATKQTVWELPQGAMLSEHTRQQPPAQTQQAGPTPAASAWEKVMSPNGPFYVNKATQQSQWECPPGFQDKL